MLDHLDGAGGAGSAIALALIEAGVAELAIHSRTPGSRAGIAVNLHRGRFA